MPERCSPIHGVKMMKTNRVTLKSKMEKIVFDSKTGRLVSFRSHKAPDQEFIASTPDHPAFAVQYLKDKSYQSLTSADAGSVKISCVKDGPETCLTMTFSRLAGMKLDVIATVTVSSDAPGSRWGITLHNDTGLEIVDIQYPFIVVGYDLKGSILWPYYAGRLMVNPAPETLSPDSSEAWQFSPENGNSYHYPGGVFAQFMAFFNTRAGLYLACEDAEANVKIFKAVHRDPGIRLGVAHVGDWPRHGSRALEYAIVLRAFKGDWYDAADLYREWTLRQKWATPIHRRDDIPQWLYDSPAYITLRIQGELDIGPVFPIKAFLPYEKAIPLLDRLARKLKAPLVAVCMAWERGGPWVYPDCFPPAGGDASMKRFCGLARKRGWRTGSYCNGSRWVTQHHWNGYDGRDSFKRRNGARSVCRTPTGALWQEWWDRVWRPSYACCLGEKQTRRIAADFVERLIGWGMDSIQFFDQNMGAATFPCFSKNHGHPSVPGKWMAAKMRQTMAGFHQAAQKVGAGEVIHSTEAPCNETCLPLFQECDVRVIPPGHVSNYDFMPLYHYLYHECIFIQGGMGMGPEPHHLATRNACNGVLGEIPGAVMIDDGSLLNKDTGNWAPWRPKVGSDDESMAMLRAVLALRRGPGRDFLMLGRMQRPARTMKGIRAIEWENQSRMNRIPAVFHAAWRAPDHRFGIVMANWTGTAQVVKVADVRLGRRVMRHTVGKRTTTVRCVLTKKGKKMSVTLPAYGCVLLEETVNS